MSSSRAWTAFRNFLHVMNTKFTGPNALYYNTFGGVILFTTGDAIQQKLEIKGGVIPKFDWKRTTRVGMVGLIAGPPHFLFYKYLEVLFPGRKSKSILSKICLDQFVACPAFNFQYFVGMALLEGKSAKESWDEFCRKFPTVYTVDWLLWPPLQVLNFYFIPPLYRVAVINVITVLWNVFLSYIKHYDQFDQTECCRRGTCECHKPNSNGKIKESQYVAFFHQVKVKRLTEAELKMAIKEAEDELRKLKESGPDLIPKKKSDK